MDKKTKPLAADFDFRSTSGHLIRMLRERSVAAFAAVAGSDEVSVQQLKVLVALYQQDRPVLQTELGEASGIDRSTIGEMIQRMVRRGLVRRRIPAHNRRARQLTITPAGERIMHDLLPKLVEANELVLSPLSQSQREALLRLLKILHEAPPVAKRKSKLRSRRAAQKSPAPGASGRTNGRSLGHA